MPVRLAVALLVLAAGPSVAAAPPAAAGPASHDLVAAVRALQSWLDGTKTLEARFRQSLVSGALGATTSESGRMYLERPGKLRWDYLDPDRKIALLIGNHTELYLEDDRQLTRGRLTAEQGLFPRLLAGREKVEELFDASLAPGAAPDRGSARLRLTPKGAAGALSEVVLTVRRGDGAIESAEVLDEAGNRTTYLLMGLKRNGKLPDGLFAFEPPPGTEVVDSP